eukprot:12826866-Alexandrium_andersonii.AAC.1
MATATQHLPKEDVVMAETDWHELQDNGKTVALTGYVKIPKSMVGKFENLSGEGGVFALCIDRHRPVA